MMLDLLTVQVTCPRCTKEFSETIRSPKDRAEDDIPRRPDNGRVTVSCPGCGL